MESTLVTSTQVTNSGRLLDLDHGTKREVRYEVWHEEDGISGQLYLRNPQTVIGFDWFEYVGSNRDVVLIVSTGRRLRLGRVLLDGQIYRSDIRKIVEDGNGDHADHLCDLLTSHATTGDLSGEIRA